ncbi:NADPH-dependent F420 reductase [Niabella drilacis]|uniref:Pyrroline-5-carboxylate reductase catalytic N-terminal domain-containing protein n=1 Tax=Niabella drilacis (strain DSM 25811 / CCM 8410 / CCUG 62505 / LMG 26954 / E90) TaxID=1285928 RepID=A0A1G6MSZ0_NIADE|nr:NAD(P)-binding domain-containing protein [Niabella drilacis]SDC58085.1 hypothetical protein SAMN04487894_1039 [Niabella drilacis]
MEENQTVAVIGLGNIGQVVAGNLAKSGRHFIVGGRNIKKVNALAESWGAAAKPSNIPDAVKAADIIILAIPFGEISGFLKQYETSLQGKLIIDPSNPIAPDESGGFKKVIGNNESAGQLNVTALPNGAELAKALGTLGADSLAGAAFQKPEQAVLFYATDDTSINADVEQLIRDNGFEPVRVGGLDQSIRLEVFGDLHEFGALGKTVTAAEAKGKI